MKETEEEKTAKELVEDKILSYKKKKNIELYKVYKDRYNDYYPEQNWP